MKHFERSGALGGLLACWLSACGGQAVQGNEGGSAGAAGPAITPSAPASPPQMEMRAPSPAAPAALQPTAAAPTEAAPAAVSGSPAILPCDVSTVLSASCGSCHGATPIGGAPMPLVTYADLMRPANTEPTKKVYELVKDRIHDTKRPMPPIGELAAADMSALDNWLAAGAPIGSASDASCGAKGPADQVAPQPTSRSHSVGRLQPTAEETCYEFKVHGGNVVDDSKFEIAPGEFYEQFYYKVPWPADSVATAYATVADNAQVLHHWLLFSTNELQPEGAHITAPLPTLLGTDPVLLAGWAVGSPNVESPRGVGFVLPDPGRTINVQWHFYNSTSSMQSDGSSLQVCTVPKASRANYANVTWAGTEDLNGNVWFGGAGMPPRKESTFTTTCTPGRKGLAADQSIHIFSFEPHMHRIGKRMTTSVKHMDGSMELVFDKPFSFGNETHYPVDVELKPGESLVTSCTFNNDTDRGVPFGESSDTEMCYQFTWAYPAFSMSNGAASLLGVQDTCW